MSIIKTTGFVETPTHISKKLVDYTRCVAGTGAILELAAGKGAITEVLFDAFVSKHKGDVELATIEFNERATLLELNPDYEATLQEKFPGAHIVIADALTYSFGRKFSYIISNPPYIRIHNLSYETKVVIEQEYSTFCTGMYDIYQAFFLLGYRLLEEGGVLSYIAPNSWLTTRGTRPMREWFSDNRCISSIEDFKGELVFKGIGTYTAIVTIQKGFKAAENYPWEISRIQKGTFPFVRTGVATLRDKIFFNKDLNAEEPVVRPALKASTGETTLCIYPYDSEGKPITEEEFKEYSPESYIYLRQNKQELARRDVPLDYPWYLYGRYQGIATMNAPKVAIAPMSKEGTLSFYMASEETIIYSGMFLPDPTEEQITELHSPRFLAYIGEVAGYKQGGYRTISASHLQNY